MGLVLVTDRKRRGAGRVYVSKSKSRARFGFGIAAVSAWSGVGWGGVSRTLKHDGKQSTRNKWFVSTRRKTCVLPHECCAVSLPAKLSHKSGSTNRWCLHSLAFRFECQTCETENTSSPCNERRASLPRACSVPLPTTLTHGAFDYQSALAEQF